MANWSLTVWLKIYEIIRKTLQNNTPRRLDTAGCLKSVRQAKKMFSKRLLLAGATAACLIGSAQPAQAAPTLTVGSTMTTINMTCRPNCEINLDAPNPATAQPADI